MSSEQPKKSRFFGMLTRRERWGFSLRGWICLLVFFVGICFAFVFGIHPFLAVNKPIQGECLVIEGWIPEYAVQQSAKIFREGNYRKIITVGGPVSGAASPAADDDTHAYVAAVRLRKLGFDAKTVEMLPIKTATRDRTYSSAVAVRKWVHGQPGSISGVNVATLGPHARRTRLLYKKAFGNDTQIGIISIQNSDYDPKRWWKFSEGVKDIISEGSAYLYARFLFHPDETAN